MKAVALHQAGRLQEAESIYRLILQAEPHHPDALNLLGVIAQQVGNSNAAVELFGKAIHANPRMALYYSNLGNALQSLGQFENAAASCRKAIELQPDCPEAHNNLGNALQSLGKFDTAVECYRQALKFKPDYSEALHNQGSALYILGRYEEALASYSQALRINPDYFETYNNLGIILYTLGRFDEAVASFRQALQLKPDYADAHSNLIFTLDLMDSVGQHELQMERNRWGEMHANRLAPGTPHPNDPVPDRRLRIGYVSADFTQHSAHKSFGGMLTRFDPALFDVYAYSNFAGKPDHITKLFQQSVTVWRDIAGLPDETVANMIREDRIDILVDLSGHTRGNRLLVFARKPAPIQITAWGYGVSTGMQAMDVLFSDPVTIPPEERQYCTEEVIDLPNAVGAFFSEPFPDVNELPASTSGAITFGSFNRIAKISEPAYRAWAEILLTTPNSRLLLKTPELDDPSVRTQVAARFTGLGVAPERIVMQGRTPWHEHMRAYGQIDLGLDPFPHGGGVTALEGLMMGVPVVTLRWPSTAGRASASIMTTLGLNDWIAETQEQYVHLALEKAKDLQALSQLRQQLRGIFTSSPLGNPAAYTRIVEQVYRKLWARWCAGINKVKAPA